METLSRAVAFVELMKPRLTLLLFFTALVEVLSHKPNEKIILFFLLSVFLFVSGTNTITCYIDRKIDKIMLRTKKRPIPRKIVKEKTALLFGIFLLFSGIVLTLLINIYVFLWGIFGSLIVISYNSIFKRLTPLNVLIASPGGAAPVLGAYSAATGKLISLESFLLALLIIFWTPIHIWSLAVFYREDYKRAKIPMLPVVEKNIINII